MPDWILPASILIAGYAIATSITAVGRAITNFHEAWHKRQLGIFPYEGALERRLIDE